MIDEKEGLDVEEAGEPEGEQDATGGVKPGGKEADPLSGLPLHLHPRGQELVAEKNAYKSKVEEYGRLGAPTELAQKLARLEILEEMVAADEEKPGTKEDEAEAAKSAWARKQLEKLLPELKGHAKKIAGLETALRGTMELVELYKVANEETAMDTTDELAPLTTLDGEHLAQKLISIIKGDRKLWRLYNTGKGDQAVKAAFEELPAKYLRKDEASIQARAEALKKSELTTSKLPKAHTPGKPEASPTPKVNTDPKQMEKNIAARLDKMGKV